MATWRRTLALPLLPLLLLTPTRPSGAQTIDDPKLFGQSLEAARQALELFGAGVDPAARERVADIGYRVAQAANFERFPLTFHVVNMPAPNAFALPGGQIFVTTGMLASGLTDDMLAGLLGHEIAHVVESHGVKMERRAALLQALSQALLVGVLVGTRNSGSGRNDGQPEPLYDPRVGTDDPRVATVQGVAASSIVLSELLLRSYSRDFEREADDEGQRYATAAGYAANGTADLMKLLKERLPQSKNYGYWQTHPFFDERLRGAEVRAEMLKPFPAKDVSAFRQKTQQALLGFVATGKPKPEAVALLKQQALTAWGKGKEAEAIRLETVRGLRDPVLQEAELSRDYGALIARYREEVATVQRLDPQSPLLAMLQEDLAALEKGRDEAKAKAVEVVAGGIYETPFLERFLSNYPTSPEVPKVALALGDAYSRRGDSGKAVAQYLAAYAAAPESAEGKRALQGLTVLVPRVDELVALARLSEKSEQAEIAALARTRLDEVAGSYKKLDNGAAYLKDFPAGAHAETVAARLETLAEQLYTEMVLYQGIGDAVKANERINEILTHAPTTRAAARLRDSASVEPS